MQHTIKFYPVGNADCTLIKLDNGKTIIIDCQILNNKDGKQVYFDVKADLLKELTKDSDGRPFVDLFINTHPHDDHCIGFEENFYQGHPVNYDDKKDLNKIIVGELWITPRSLSNDLSSAAAVIRREAKRRRELYDKDNNFNGNTGNYLRIIGYDKDREFSQRYGYIPGKLVEEANGDFFDLLEIFIHAPFKEDIKLSKEQNDKNASSIVVQFSFFTNDSQTPISRFLMGGDAEHEIWQHILDNNQDEDRLKWHIFQAPHHSSWTFFNESGNKTEIKQSAIDIMNKQIGNKAFVIASSNEIEDDEQNPPCHQAKEEYKSRLRNSDNFINTAIDHKKNGIPQPIVFYIDNKGKRKHEHSVSSGTSTYNRPAARAGKK